MNKQELKSLIKEVVIQFVTEEMSEGEYDPRSDTMAYEPRDRIPGDEGPDKLTQAIQKLNQVASRLKTLIEVCNKNNLPNLAKQTEDMMYDILKFTKSK